MKKRLAPTPDAPTWSRGSVNGHVAVAVAVTVNDAVNVNE
jgi:hypothetical protein